MRDLALPSADLRLKARDLYGQDPFGYEAGRPEYPEEVYDLLATRCGLRGGASVLEIGPGTGRVTQHLTAVGANVVAVEPDPALAAYLRSTAGNAIDVVQATFEQVLLRDEAFDLVVGAMSFHWSTRMWVCRSSVVSCDLVAG